MNARMNGRTTAPNGTIIRHDSHGDNPAFLQMNQNGNTATSAKIAPSTRMMMISGVPRGPMDASNRFWIFIVVNVAPEPIVICSHLTAPASDWSIPFCG